MEKCCVCLTTKKYSVLLNIFRVDIQSLCSYSAMIHFVTNIKINENSTLNICRLCIKNLKDAYEFKKKVLESNLVLNNCAESDKSKICFNTMQELKEILQINVCELKPKISNFCEDIKNTSIYNGVTIQKVAAKNNVHIKKEPIPILDFLKAVDEESNEDESSNPDYDMDLGNSSNCDTSEYEYSLPLTARLKNKKSKRKIRNLKCSLPSTTSRETKQITITPELIPFIRIVRSKQLLKVDNKENKKNNKLYEICPYCGKSMKHLDIHLRLHTANKDFACTKCDKRFYVQSDLARHEKLHFYGKTFKCDECAASFNDKYSLQCHITIHSDIRDNVCSVCQKAFKRKQHLRRHFKIHNGASKSISCDQCKLSFLSNSGLRHHMRVHTGERPYNCEICPQPYSYKHDFNRHCLKKHGVFLKRRKVCIMNQEVLLKEKQITRELLEMSQGKGNPSTCEREEFQGPDGILALNIALRDFKKEDVLKYVLL